MFAILHFVGIGADHLIDDFIVFALTLLLVVLSLPTIVQIVGILGTGRPFAHNSSPSGPPSIGVPTATTNRLTV